MICMAASYDGTRLYWECLLSIPPRHPLRSQHILHGAARITARRAARGACPSATARTSPSATGPGWCQFGVTHVISCYYVAEAALVATSHEKKPHSEGQLVQPRQPSRRRNKGRESSRNGEGRPPPRLGPCAR